MGEEYLVVGLGNPGTKYEKTRHNLGFMVVEALAKKHGLGFKKGWRLEGHITTGVIGSQQVILLKPNTYMNLSGTAVRKAVHYYKVPLERVLIVVDDVYLDLGVMRLRSSGGTGGHNGLKNIDVCLGTQGYPRLRMGVGPWGEDLPNSRQMALEEYVLAAFTPDEHPLLLQTVERGAFVVEEWLRTGLEAASQCAANIRK